MKRINAEGQVRGVLGKLVLLSEPGTGKAIPECYQTATLRRGISST
jgi:hypothetical protein